MEPGFGRSGRADRALPGLGLAAAFGLILAALAAWVRLDLAAGRPALAPVARLLWRLAGNSLWAFEYRRPAAAAAIAFTAAGLALLGLRLNSRAANRLPRTTAAGGPLICLGLGLGAAAGPSIWLPLLPAAAAGALLGARRPGPDREPGSGRRAWAVMLGLTTAAGLLRLAAIDRFPAGVAGHAAGHILLSYRTLQGILAGTYPHPEFGPRPLAALHFLVTESNSTQHVIDWLTLPALGWDWRNQRLAAAMIGLATLPALYLAGRRLLGRRAALAAAAVLAISAWHNTWCRYEGAIQIQAPLHQAIGLLLVWRLLAAADRSCRWRRAAAAGFWAGGACLLHASSHGFPAVLALALAVEIGGRPATERRPWLAPAALAVGLAAAVYLARFAHLGWDLEQFLNTPVDPNLPPAHLRLAANLRAIPEQLLACGQGMHFRYLVPHGLLDPVLAVLAPIGLGVALRRPLARAPVLLMAAILAAVAPALLAPEPAPRRLINLLVPACLLAGLAWEQLARPLGRLAAPAGALALAGAGALQAAMLFSGQAPFETEYSYPYALAAEIARPLLETHTVLVPDELTNFDHFEAADLARLARGGPPRLVRVRPGELAGTLARPEGFEAPPVLVGPEDPALTNELAGIPGVRIEVVEHGWEAPRAARHRFLVARFESASPASAASSWPAPADPR